MAQLRIVLLLGLAALVGCQRSAAPAKPVVTPQEQMKATLEKVVKGDEVQGSELGLVMSGIEAMKKTDPDKANALAPQAQELMKLTMTKNKEGAKAKAKEILGKL